MQFNDPVYEKSHMMKVMALDTLTCIIGLLVAAYPFITTLYPGDIDTTSHIALGMLIAAPAAFRVLTAYASLWVEVVLAAFGVLVLLMPKIMHMSWDKHYNTAHLAAGGAIIVLSLISLIVTIPVAKKYGG
jgi:hypothetical protein